MGERKQAKGKVGRRPTGQTTPWAPPTPADPATCRASHPLGTANTRRPRRPAGQATHRAPATQVQPVPLSARARGCKGRSPLHENNLNIPLPRRGRGAGGWGKESKPKARLAGDQPGKPPLGHRQRPPIRRPAGQATLWAPPTPAAPATCRANLPPGTTVAGIASAAGQATHRAPQRQG